MTSWTIACQSSLSITNSQSLPRLMSIESMMPSNNLIHSCPLSSCLQSFPASGSFPMSHHTSWPKYWSFSFSIGPSNEYSGLISFRIEWFDLLSAQGTLKSFLQKPQFKSINSLALSLLYGPHLSIIHDYWKNNSFD